MTYPFTEQIIDKLWTHFYSINNEVEFSDRMNGQNLVFLPSMVFFLPILAFFAKMSKFQKDESPNSANFDKTKTILFHQNLAFLPNLAKSAICGNS